MNKRTKLILGIGLGALIVLTGAVYGLAKTGKINLKLLADELGGKSGTPSIMEVLVKNQDGNPIAGAFVTAKKGASEVSNTTSASGIAVLGGLTPSTTYSVTASIGGCSAQSNFNSGSGGVVNKTMVINCGDDDGGGGTPPTPPTCGGVTCAANQYCLDQRCVPKCTNDSQCPTGKKCDLTSGACFTPQIEYFTLEGKTVGPAATSPLDGVKYKSEGVEKVTSDGGRYSIRMQVSSSTMDFFTKEGFVPNRPELSELLGGTRPTANATIQAAKDILMKSTAGVSQWSYFAHIYEYDDRPDVVHGASVTVTKVASTPGESGRSWTGESKPNPLIEKYGLKYNLEIPNIQLQPGSSYEVIVSRSGFESYKSTISASAIKEYSSDQEYLKYYFERIKLNKKSSKLYEVRGRVGLENDPKSLMLAKVSAYGNDYWANVYALPSFNTSIINYKTGFLTVGESDTFELKFSGWPQSYIPSRNANCSAATGICKIPISAFKEDTSTTGFPGDKFYVAQQDFLLKKFDTTNLKKFEIQGDVWDYSKTNLLSAKVRVTCNQFGISKETTSRGGGSQVEGGNYNIAEVPIIDDAEYTLEVISETSQSAASPKKVTFMKKNLVDIDQGDGEMFVFTQDFKLMSDSATKKVIFRHAVNPKIFINVRTDLSKYSIKCMRSNGSADCQTSVNLDTDNTAVVFTYKPSADYNSIALIIESEKYIYAGELLDLGPESIVYLLPKSNIASGLIHRKADIGGAPIVEFYTYANPNLNQKLDGFESLAGEFGTYKQLDDYGKLIQAQFTAYGLKSPDKVVVFITTSNPNDYTEQELYNSNFITTIAGASSPGDTPKKIYFYNMTEDEILSPESFFHEIQKNLNTRINWGTTGGPSQGVIDTVVSKYIDLFQSEAAKAADNSESPSVDNFLTAWMLHSDIVGEMLEYYKDHDTQTYNLISYYDQYFNERFPKATPLGQDLALKNKYAVASSNDYSKTMAEYGYFEVAKRKYNTVAPLSQMAVNENQIYQGVWQQSVFNQLPTEKKVAIQLNIYKNQIIEAVTSNKAYTEVRDVILEVNTFIEQALEKIGIRFSNKFVKGQVLDQETRRPMPGVKVTIGRKSAITNETGSYRINRLQLGQNSIVVKDENIGKSYQIANGASINNTNSDNFNKTIEIENWNKSTVDGVVLKKNNVVLDGGKLLVYPVYGEPEEFVIDKDGKFNFRLFEGKYKFVLKDKDGKTRAIESVKGADSAANILITDRFETEIKMK